MHYPLLDNLILEKMVSNLRVNRGPSIKFMGDNLESEEDNTITYRTRAIKGRSQLVAARLRFQGKNDFLCYFYVII